jgi:hypothetical protein
VLGCYSANERTCDDNELSFFPQKIGVKIAQNTASAVVLLVGPPADAGFVFCAVLTQLFAHSVFFHILGEQVNGTDFLADSSLAQLSDGAADGVDDVDDAASDEQKRDEAGRKKSRLLAVFQYNASEKKYESSLLFPDPASHHLSHRHAQHRHRM